MNVFVTTRIMEGGNVCCLLGKLYDGTQSVKVVVDKSVEKAANKIGCSLIVQHVAAATHEEGRNTELDLDDLPDLQVAMLHDSVGRFLTVRTERNVGASSSTPQSLPSALRGMMDAQVRTPRALPAPPTGQCYPCQCWASMLGINVFLICACLSQNNFFQCYPCHLHVKT